MTAQAIRLMVSDAESLRRTGLLPNEETLAKILAASPAFHHESPTESPPPTDPVPKPTPTPDLFAGLDEPRPGRPIRSTPPPSSAQPLSRKEKRTLAKKEKAAEARAKHAWPHQAQNECRVTQSEKPRSPEAACIVRTLLRHPASRIPPPLAFLAFRSLKFTTPSPRGLASCLGAIPERHRRGCAPFPDLLPPALERSEANSAALQRDEAKCSAATRRTHSFCSSGRMVRPGPSARGGTLFVSGARRIYCIRLVEDP